MLGPLAYFLIQSQNQQNPGVHVIATSLTRHCLFYTYRYIHSSFSTLVIFSNNLNFVIVTNTFYLQHRLHSSHRTIAKFGNKMAFPRSCMLILATWSKSLLVAEGAHLHDGGLNLMEDTQLTPSPAPVTVPAPAAAAPLTIQAHTLNVSVRNFKKSLKEVVARLCGPNDDIVVSNLAPERVDHLRTAGDIPRVLQDLQIGANFPGTVLFINIDFGFAMGDASLCGVALEYGRTNHIHNKYFQLQVQLHDANGGVIPAETKIKWKNRMREGCSNCRTGIEALLHTGYKVTVTAIVVTVASINPGAIGGVIGTCATTFVLLIPAILINLFHPLAGASLLAWGVKTGFCIGGVGGASLEGSVAGLTAWDDLTEDSEAKIQPRIEAFWERKIDGRVRDWANALDARMHGYGEGIRDRGLSIHLVLNNICLGQSRWKEVD